MQSSKIVDNSKFVLDRTWERVDILRWQNSSNIHHSSWWQDQWKPLVDPNRFSNWPRLFGTIRTVFLAIRVLKRLIKRDVLCNLDNFASDENKARNFLTRISQSTHFKDTFTRLERGLPLDKKVNLLPYTPFLVSDGLLRVERRNQKSGFPFQSKHPVILHSKCRVAKLLIKKAHHDCGNHGIEHVRAHIQATFMIFGIRRALWGSTA